MVWFQSYHDIMTMFEVLELLNGCFFFGAMFSIPTSYDAESGVYGTLLISPFSDLCRSQNIIRNLYLPLFDVFACVEHQIHEILS